MGVDHGGGDIGVTEQFLYGPDIIAVFQQMGGKTMAEDMRGYVFAYLCFSRGGLQAAPEHISGLMVTSDFPRARVPRASRGRKYILPDPFPSCVGVFAGQPLGKVNSTKSFPQI